LQCNLRLPLICRFGAIPTDIGAPPLHQRLDDLVDTLNEQPHVPASADLRRPRVPLRSHLRRRLESLQPQGYISDFARVIDPQSKAALELYCTRVEQATGSQMALVTIPTLEGEPIEDVANTIFRAWGVGQKGKNEVIMLLLVINDRRSRLEVGYGLEPILLDGFAGSILREMRPALRNRQYGDAVMAAAQIIGTMIAKSKNVSLNAQLPRRGSYSEQIPLPIVLATFFAVLWLMRLLVLGSGDGGGLWTGPMLGNLQRLVPAAAWRQSAPPDPEWSSAATKTFCYFLVLQERPPGNALDPTPRCSTSAKPRSCSYPSVAFRSTCPNRCPPLRP
jgi:uncharacterized protein